MIATGLQPIITALAAASPPGGAPGGARLIDTIDFTDMCTFASSWEHDAVKRYPLSSERVLTQPAIKAKVRDLRDRLLDRWLGGESAVTKDLLLTEALTLTPDPGSALILCYHVCQLFSRSFRTVYWQRVRDWKADGGVLIPGSTVQPTGDPVTDDDYTNGTDFYRLIETNPAAPGEVLQVGGRDSIFYLLFDKTEEWGVADPGDWYHFFLMASTAFYAATGRVTDRDLPENIAAQLITAFARGTLQGMQNVEQVPEVPFVSMTRYEAAWRWANALSFVEGGIFGQEDVTDESGVHRKGCLYGVRLAGMTHHPGHLHWWVPTPGQLGKDFGVYLAQYHPIDVDAIRKVGGEDAFWNTFAAIGFDDPGIQGFLDLLRSQGPASGRVLCVLDGATGAVLPSFPVAGLP
jgi:hypothetical protein